jgi:hypothetical protein
VLIVTGRQEPNLEFTMKLNKALMVPAILGAKPSAAEDENYRIGYLPFRELPAFCGSD